jgi:hypothetical protein
VLKWLTLFLFAYVATLFMVKGKLLLIEPSQATRH